MSAFSFTSKVPEIAGVDFSHNPHVATAGIATLVLLAVSIYAKASLGSGKEAMMPTNKFSIRGIFEVITEFIVGLADSIIGKDARHYVPFFAAIFTFTLFNNLIGIIPGMSPATESLNTTFAMGAFVFITYNLIGIKVHGFGYIKQFLGPVWWLAPLMLAIEIISHLIRPLSLGLRLGNVLRVDHTVVGLFTDLVPVIVPVPFYMLGLLVCVVQALVFTLLSMVYVSLARSHDH